MLLAAALLAGGTALPARAAETTTRCHFGGWTGTYRVMRLELPGGSESLNLIHTASRLSRVSGPESWHLAVGAFVIDESTGELMAYRVENLGTNPRRVVAESGAERSVEAPLPGPDTPFAHSDLSSRVFGLPAGSYLIVAFGSDGSPTPPNDQWGGEVEVAGRHTCSILDTGELIDVNHTEFTGGTQVATPLGAVLDGASLTKDVAHDLVVGFIDAGFQGGVGTATVTFEHPGGSELVDRDIVPFVVPGGTLRWTATLQGAGALASIVALGIDV